MDFKNMVEDFIVESGVRIKRGGENPKHLVLFSHVDMDGLCSAMVAYRQLIKQGLKPEQISLRPLQYGSNAPEIMKLKSGQHGVVVDYGDFDEKIFSDAGFTISDHHEAKTGYGLGTNNATKVIVDKAGYRGLPNQNMEKEVFSKNGMRHGSERDPKRLAQLKDIHKSDTQRFAVLHTTNLIDPSFLRDVSKVDSASYDDLSEIVDKPITKQALPGILNYLISKVIAPDVKTGSSGSRSTGAFEWLVRNGTPTLYGLWNNLQSDELKSLASREVELAKELAKKPEQRDANKINELMGGLTKGTARKVMKGSQNSDVEKIKSFIRRLEKGERSGNVYDEKTKTTGPIGLRKELIDYANLHTWNRKAKDAIEHLSIDNGTSNVDPETVKKIGERKAALKKVLQDKLAELGYDKDFGRTNDGNSVKTTNKAEIEAERKKELARMTDASNIETTGFKAKSGTVVKLDATKKGKEVGNEHELVGDGKAPNRFAGSMLTSPNDGKRYPINIRRWDSSIQISANPDMNPEDKQKINLVEAAKKAISEARNTIGGQMKDEINKYFTAMGDIKDGEFKNTNYYSRPGGKKSEYDKEMEGRSKEVVKNAYLRDKIDDIHRVFPSMAGVAKKTSDLVDFGFKKMMEQCGGHKAIATISNFNLATLAPEEVRSLLKDIKAIEVRLSAQEKNGKDVARMKEHVAKLREFPDHIKKMFDDNRTKLMDFIEDYLVKYCDQLKLERVSKPISGQERFVMRKGAAKKKEEKEVAKEAAKEKDAPWDKLAKTKLAELEAKRRPDGIAIPSKKVGFVKAVMKDL